MSTAIVWFRNDLRVADNSALQAAIQRGGAVIPAFCWTPAEEGAWPPGGASRWWLHQSLRALDTDLRARDSRLLIRSGPTLRNLKSLLKETGADAVFWNRRYEPAILARDRRKRRPRHPTQIRQCEHPIWTCLTTPQPPHVTWASRTCPHCASLSNRSTCPTARSLCQRGDRPWTSARRARARW